MSQSDWISFLWH